MLHYLAFSASIFIFITNLVLERIFGAPLNTMFILIMLSTHLVLACNVLLILRDLNYGHHDTQRNEIVMIGFIISIAAGGLSLIRQGLTLVTV